MSRDGISLMGIREVADFYEFDTLSTQLSVEQLIDKKSHFPCILHWDQKHFVVLNKVTKNAISKTFYFHVYDPAHGILKLTKEKFIQSWISHSDMGIALFLSPRSEFYNIKSTKNRISLKQLFKHLVPFKKSLFIMFFLLLLGSCVTFILPFLTGALIDKGISQKNINSINIILLAQLSLFFGATIIDIVRNYIVLKLGTKLSVNVMSEFFGRLLKLPVSFFDTKMMGDFNQRIQDNEKIETFLTSQSLLTFFSMITLSVFLGILFYFDVKILLVYFGLTVLSVFWSSYWLKKRKIIDYFRFRQKSENQESIYEMLSGVIDLKLNLYDDLKIKEWKIIQENLFKTNLRASRIDQIQMAGFEFINQFKNILVTYIAATYVVHDKMTLGILMSVSYIIGQMNSPVNQLISFFRSLQDAKLSLERLNEVQNHPLEIQEGLVDVKNGKINNSSGISLSNVSFQYEGPQSPFVINNINLFIPNGKVTAIVGASGSGKTTLMKLMLRFYAPSNGEIYYNTSNLNDINIVNLRSISGVVMQDGYIFSDTIERNIATGDEHIDRERLNHAVKVANVESFIEELPLGFSTKIGAAGNGISGGQKQRILIARAVYKNPHYILFDEATSALDAENEKIIHDNLQSFFKGKTVVIIAHRLSTVKNADQIIVLKHGKIVEQGTHHELVSLKNEYFNLVKNQLELGS